MQHIEYIQEQSTLRIWYEISSTTLDYNGVDIKMELEILDTGTLYRQEWTPDTIPIINKIFDVDLELSVDAMKQKPDDIRFSEARAVCMFSINLGSKNHDISFVLPRVVVEGEPDNASDKVRVLTRRVKTLEDAYLSSASVPLELISQVNESGLPKTYLRISKQFPHLRLEEIIAFDKHVRDNGGSVQTHSGKWELSDRSCNKCSYLGTLKTINNSWDCCGPVVHQAYNGTHRLRNFGTRGRTLAHDQGGEYTINKPDSKCTAPITFHLYEQDEKTIDIAEVKVKDAVANIQKNISLYQKTIDDMTKEIGRLTNINKALQKITIVE